MMLFACVRANLNSQTGLRLVAKPCFCLIPRCDFRSRMGFPSFVDVFMKIGGLFFSFWWRYVTFLFLSIEISFLISLYFIFCFLYRFFFSSALHKLKVIATIRIITGFINFVSFLFSDFWIFFFFLNLHLVFCANQLKLDDKEINTSDFWKRQIIIASMHK